MITELIRKQLENELRKIYGNLESFAETMFGGHEAQMVRDEAITYYIAFDFQYLYVQKYWTVDGEGHVQETNVEYDQYNEWVRGIENDG